MIDPLRAIAQEDALERIRLAGCPITSWRLFDCENATRLTAEQALFPGELTAVEVFHLEQALWARRLGKGLDARIAEVVQGL